MQRLSAGSQRHDVPRPSMSQRLILLYQRGRYADRRESRVSQRLSKR